VQQAWLKTSNNEQNFDGCAVNRHAKSKIAAQTRCLDFAAACYVSAKAKDLIGQSVFGITGVVCQLFTPEQESNQDRICGFIDIVNV
jgi:hypothetical protein